MDIPYERHLDNRPKWKYAHSRRKLQLQQQIIQKRHITTTIHIFIVLGIQWETEQVMESTGGGVWRDDGLKDRKGHRDESDVADKNIEIFQ